MTSRLSDKPNKSLTVHGVLSVMKEKRLRDGKRGPRKMRVSTVGEAPAPRADAWRPKRSGSVRMKGEGPKERRYVIDDNGREHHVFDPETSLHVGKHDGKIGIVYRFRTDDKWCPWGDPRDYDTTSTDRGLIPWDGNGGKDALRRAAARVALEKGKITKPAEWMVEKLSRPGAWGARSSGIS